MRKYEFVKGDHVHSKTGALLTRIVALKDIPESGVVVGDLGGYIEHEGNLSHVDSCWVGEDAKVWDSAQITAAALVKGISEVYEEARVGGNSIVSEAAEICGEASVFGTSSIKGTALLKERCIVTDSCVGDQVTIRGDVRLNTCTVFGPHVLGGNSYYKDNILTLDPSSISSNNPCMEIPLSGSSEFSEDEDDGGVAYEKRGKRLEVALKILYNKDLSQAVMEEYWDDEVLDVRSFLRGVLSKELADKIFDRFNEL